MNKETVTNSPMLNRAIEVSLVSNTPIIILGKIKHLKDIDILKKDLNFLTFGNFTNIDVSIKIEYEPSLIENVNFENWKDVFIRVDKAKNNNLENTVIPQNGKILLNTAIDKLDLNNNQVQFIKKLSKDIAKLRGSKTISIEHIAEAIQYSYKNITEYKQLIELEIKYLKEELNKF